jgi:PST family polysaccharide transporter
LRFGVVAANDIVSLAAGLLVALWLAQRGAGYWALVAQQLVQGAACAVGGWTACRWRPSLPRRGEDIGAIVRYGVHLTSVNLVDNLARNADNCLIGRYCGVIQLGLYSRAYQFFILPVTQVTGPLGNVALATLSRLTEQPEAYRRSYLRAVEKIAIVTVPGAAILLVCADWVVAIMLGPHWGAVSAILRILGVAALTQPMTTTVWWLFTSQGRTREMTRWGGILSALAVAAFVIGLPWGARGVAGAYVVVDLVFRLPISFALVGRTGPVGARDLWRLVTPFMTIGGATVAALAAFRTCTAWSSPVTGIAVSAALAAVVTAAGLASYEGGRAAAFDLLRVVRGLATSLVARVARRAPT